MSNLRKVIEQMNKYGFTAPDMTVTEFVEDILLTISKTESVECEDCISREVACQKMMEMYKEDCEMYGVEIPECFDGHRAVRALMELPSAQPEQRWIPVSEHLPKQNEMVLITIIRKDERYNKIPFISTGYISWNNTAW